MVLDDGEYFHWQSRWFNYFYIMVDRPEEKVRISADGNQSRLGILWLLLVMLILVVFSDFLTLSKGKAIT